MNNLILDNHVIKKDIKSILDLLKSQLDNGKLKNIKYKGDQVQITCPFHKDGKEETPSCGIYVGDSSDTIFGTFHCFTCGKKGSLDYFVAECLDAPQTYGKSWLKKYFTEYILSEDTSLIIDEPIIIDNKVNYKKDNNINLDDFQSWHPYLAKRHLSKEVCEKFNVKYDPKTECIVFPVNDEKGNIQFLTRRSVNTKQFIIDAAVEKPVYLLDNILKNNYNEVYVVESQINALTLETWGYNAIALFGTGSKYQYELLNKTSIMFYHLCFDGDDAGKKGISNFIKNIKDSCFIDIIQIPQGKDVNDLTKEEFEKLNIIDKESWLKL